MTTTNNEFLTFLQEETSGLAEREATGNKWLHADGTPKKNYTWKIASKTPQGDAGETVVCRALHTVLAKVDPAVVVERVNGGIGEFDIRVIFSDGRVVLIEVKTATEDVNGAHQFNGLKKDVEYDFAFLLGVAPEDFFFQIRSKEFLCQTMTTNMSKGVVGAYKYTQAQKKLLELTEDNLFTVLQSCDIIK